MNDRRVSCSAALSSFHLTLGRFCTKAHSGLSIGNFSVADVGWWRWIFYLHYVFALQFCNNFKRGRRTNNLPVHYRLKLCFLLWEFFPSYQKFFSYHFSNFALFSIFIVFVMQKILKVKVPILPFPCLVSLTGFSILTLPRVADCNYVCWSGFCGECRDARLEREREIVKELPSSSVQV